MNEISTKDVKELKTPSNGYQDIKPQSNINYQDVKNYWDECLNKNERNLEPIVYGLKNDSGDVDLNSPKEYLDDNGEKYRTGDHLEPKKTYEINGYKYKTDTQGRIVSAEGKLRIQDKEYTRDMEDVKHMDSQEYRDSDDRGHLIGHQFGGSDKLENLVPMNQDLNRKDFKKLEGTLADAVKNGDDVRLKVEPVYQGDSTRPSEFKVSYSINGDKEIIVFKNESGEKHD